MPPQLRDCLCQLLLGAAGFIRLGEGDKSPHRLQRAYASVAGARRENHHLVTSRFSSDSTQDYDFHFPSEEGNPHRLPHMATPTTRGSFLARRDLPSEASSASQPPNDHHALHLDVADQIGNNGQADIYHGPYSWHLEHERVVQDILQSPARLTSDDS